jgi:hypothetical protein
MAQKSDNAKSKAQEILDRIKANQNQGSNKFDPKNDLNFKPNARLGSINRSRR